MSETFWLTIVGIGEDGPEGLAPASQKAISGAEVIIGARRHLDLLPSDDKERIVWPVPFAEGLSLLDGLKGRQTVVLASGDPFWFGAGSILAARYDPAEWCAHPGPSVFSLAAARLGWPLEDVACLGCHAAPFARLRPYLSPGRRLLVTLRDGKAAAGLAHYLVEQGFEDTQCIVLEALGGPRENLRKVRAGDCNLSDVLHPVCFGLVVKGKGTALSLASGQPDDVFDTDGQMTKRPIRALTLSALAPKAGEHLWDIGSGTGSIAIEWLLGHPANQATSIEVNPERAERIRKNADHLGQDRISVVEGAAPEALGGLPRPDAVFIGGGLSDALIDWLWQHLEPETRIVANAVTLETMAIITDAQARLGGDLMKVDLAMAAPIGRFRGWKSSYPVVQWSVTR